MQMDPDYEPAEFETRTIFGLKLEQLRNNSRIDKSFFTNIPSKRKEVCDLLIPIPGFRQQSFIIMKFCCVLFIMTCSLVIGSILKATWKPTMYDPYSFLILIYAIVFFILCFVYDKELIFCCYKKSFFIEWK